VNACEILRLPASKRRAVYNALKRDAARHGERSIPFTAWLKLLKQLCVMQQSDPGGDIQL